MARSSPSVSLFGKKMKSRAYYSDPEHNRSFVGRWVWIYRGKGSLELTKDKLRFISRGLKLELDREHVESISLGTFPRTAKPIPLRFVDLAFVTPIGEAKHIYIVPVLAHRSAWLTSVCRVNRNVNEWFKALNDWLAGASCPPNGGPATPLRNSGGTERPSVS